jgi:hypothetical protein
VRLAFLVVVTFLLAWATRMPAAQWLEHLEAQRTGQMPLLLARAASLAMLLVLTPPRKPLLMIAALALCTASLAINAAAVPFALLVIYAAWPGRTAIACVVSIAAGFALAQPSPPPSIPTEPREAALYWEKRDNPFRALHAARAWAQNDRREATLLMARIAERLGDVDDARALRESVR